MNIWIMVKCTSSRSRFDIMLTYWRLLVSIKPSEYGVIIFVSLPHVNGKVREPPIELESTAYLLSLLISASRGSNKSNDKHSGSSSLTLYLLNANPSEHLSLHEREFSSKVSQY